MNLRTCRRCLGPMMVLSFLSANAALGQDRRLEPLVQGAVTPLGPVVYIATAKAGEVVSGTLELLRGAPIGIQIFNPAGTKLKDFEANEPGQTAVGFEARTAGAYRIRLYRAHAALGDSASGSFSLRMQSSQPIATMAGVNVFPVVRYESPRILKLAKDVHDGRGDAVSRFWAEAATNGGPIIEPMPTSADDQHVLVTFLWKETYETHNVLVVWPPAVFAARDFYMTKLLGTDVWYKTLRVHKGSRFSYQLSPNDREADRPFTAGKDPLNPRLPYPEDFDYSLLELAGAPEESWALRTPQVRGVVTAQKFESALLNGARPISIYTPPGYDTSRGAYPLLLLFDGSTYLSGFRARENLDNLIAAHQIRPAVVCFLSSPGTRSQDMNAKWQTFADAIATELVPRLRSLYAISENPKEVIVGGYSASGRGAALVALRHPEVFGNVLSQSGTFGAPFLTSAGVNEPNGISRLFIEAAKLPIRFFLDVGLYEQNNGNLPVDEQALTESMTVGNRHFRDVLEAKGYQVTYRETGGEHGGVHFRATFAEALMTLLSPATP